MTLYTSKVIAQWLCLTERRVRQLRDEGVIVEARPGLYELQPTVARYIKYLGGAGKESLNTERMKLTAEKRKAAEMDNDLRRGDLHSTQDIEKGIQTMCLNIRSRFLAMPAKLSPTLAAMDGNQAAIFDEMKNKDPCAGCVWRIWTGDESGLCFFPDCRRKEYDRLWGSKKAKAAGNTAGDNGNAGAVCGNAETAPGADTIPMG